MPVNAPALPIRTGEFNLENQQYPYINLRKILSTFVDHDSCGNRTDEGFYQFAVYCTNKRELKEICDEIINLYEYSTLQCQNRNILSVLFSGKQAIEIEPGIFQAVLNFEILTERIYNSSPRVASGLTINNALYNLYIEAPDLKSSLKHAFFSSYALEGTEYPFSVLEAENETILDRSSCKKLINNELIFGIYDTKAENVEIIKEKFMDAYDFCRLIIDDSLFISMLYQSDDLQELEPGLWRGGIGYELIVEK